MASEKRVTCAECGNTYDRLLLRCPYCRKGNENRPNTRMTFLPIPYQISLFLIGLIGINVLAVLFSLIFAVVVKDNDPYKYLLINSMTYITLFVIDFCVILKYYNEFLEPFKKGRTYIAGLVGFAFIYGASLLVSYIMSVLVPSAGTGGNQSIAEMMILNNPVVCIFVIGLMGPFVEECAYRIGLFSLCKRASRVLAYILAIIVFAFIHIDFFSGNIINELVALPDYLIAAALFCVLYDLEGFGAVFIAHALNNLLSIILIVSLNK